MKQKNIKNRDRLLHHLLDGADTGTGLDGLTGPQTDRVSRYREDLKRLETHEEKAPDDFTSRVMAALPDKPRLIWTDRLKSFWPERRFWPIPALTGAFAMLLIGLTLLRTPSNTPLIPMVLDLYAPSAKKVELVGTFSNWMPKAFRLKGPDAVGYWAIAVKLPPGRYEYAFLINGSQVVPDDDGEALRSDGFGHENSLLVLRGTPRQLDPQYGFTSDEYVTILEKDPDGEVLALPQGNRDQWQAILAQGIASGVQKHTMENLVEHLASVNLSPDQGRVILEPLFQDAQAGHPERHVFLKIHECLLKKARPDTLKSMAQNRHEAFKNAKALLAGTGYGTSVGTDPALLDTTAFALESGQTPASLQALLTAAKGKSAYQITSVIEAGEALHHAGLKPESLQLILQDCLQKNLEPKEMKRITGHIKERIQKGIDHKAIYDELWV